MKNVMKSVFSADIERFLAYKRAQGYKYESGEWALRNFDTFCDTRNISQNVLTRDIAEQWSNKRDGEHHKVHQKRMASLRQFALFLENEGRQVYVLPYLSAAAYSTEDFTPYIFSQSELTAIFCAVDERIDYNNATVRMSEIMPVMFRVMYGCGLRVSEACALRKQDVDTVNGVLTILKSKNDTDRLVPMSPSLAERVRFYMGKMEYICPNMKYAFPNRSGGQLVRNTVYARFRDALFEAGITHGGRGAGPRLHDLRHTFAVHSLEKMAASGMDLYCALPVLSTYLGHNEVTSTEKYLRLTQEVHGAVLKQVANAYGEIAPDFGKGDK
jgi:integrase